MVSSLDERDGVSAEIGLVLAVVLNPLPDDVREPAVELSARAAGVEPGQMEAGPADDVVLKVRSLPLDGVVDREQQLGPFAPVQPVVHLRRVELRAGVRAVPAEPEIAV